MVPAYFGAIGDFCDRMILLPTLNSSSISFGVQPGKQRFHFPNCAGFAAGAGGVAQSATESQPSRPDRRNRRRTEKIGADAEKYLDSKTRSRKKN